MQHPTLSLCISTSGRLPLLKQCLESVALQDFPLSNLEILIPVEHSLMESTHFECSHFDLPIQLLPMEGLTSSAARNLGLENAKGDLLYFLDDDCSFFSPQHLKNLVAYHERHSDVTVIGGRYSDGDSSTRWGRAYNLVCNSWQDRHIENGLASTHSGFVGGNLSLKLNRSSRNIRFGNVVEFGAEEIHYIYDLQTAGHKCLLVNGLTVHHNAQHNMKTFFSRAWLHGQNKYHLNRESVRKVFGDRKYLFDRRSRFSSKSLATLYIGCAQISWLTESTRRRLEKTL